MSTSHLLRLPYPPYVVRIVLRTILMCLLVKLLFLLLFGVFLMLDQAVAAFAFPTLGIPALLVWLDRKAAHEHLLHANLGASELWLVGLSLLTSLTIDALVLALLGGA